MFFSWFSEKGLKQGIFWAIMIYLVGALNDVLARFLGTRLHAVEIAFFRFFFSVAIVLIPMLRSRQNLFKSDMHFWHLLRGILGAIAFIIFLKEKISKTAICATFLGFSGLIMMFRPRAENINVLAFIPTCAALLFAVMNIMIKKMVDHKENTLTMLFYFGLYTTLISAVVVPIYWTTPTLKEFCLIFLLGIGANLIQLFIFLAYRATTASAISPVRYIELPFAVLFGFVFFNQIPDLITLLGATLIISGTFVASGKTNI